eukprot:Skav205180  [mRNA]  locus=scaffold1333:70350:75684:+ [translate_table: standard]
MAAKDWLIKNFLILGLLAVITFGLVCPAPGEALDGIQIGTFRLPQVAVILIFIVSGLCLDSISECLQYKALTLSIVLVLGGLAVFCVVPTTLSSGVTMVTQAKAHWHCEGTAMSDVVRRRLMCHDVSPLPCRGQRVGTMPWSVSKIFETTVPIKPSEMLFELIWLTLVPLIVGMLLRESADLGMALAIAAGIHLVYRVVGHRGSDVEPEIFARLRRGPDKLRLQAMCDGDLRVSVMSALPADLRRNSGLMIVPCIMAHASQLIIDSILAVRGDLRACLG